MDTTAPMNSFAVLRALKPCIPGALIVTGRTNLPVLTVPGQQVQGTQVGPLRVFYNLAPKQFRIVNDNDPKYEHRCGTAAEVLYELESVLDTDLKGPPEELLDLK